jgi:hypothetical protein
LQTSKAPAKRQQGRTGTLRKSGIVLEICTFEQNWLALELAVMRVGQSRRFNGNRIITQKK